MISSNAYLSCVPIVAYACAAASASFVEAGETEGREGGVRAVLRVAERAGIARAGEPVTRGVPLPESAGIADPSNLELADSDGKPAPAQFRVLSRWGDVSDAAKPIRWVLVDFQADVPANSASEYVLRSGKRRDTPGGLTIVDGDAAVEIETGAARFRISKKAFNLFDEVALKAAGKAEALVPPSNESGFAIVMPDGKRYSSANLAPREVKVEESGPLRGSVLVRGCFADADGKTLKGGNSWPDVRAKSDPKGGGPWGWEGFRPEQDLLPIAYTARIHFFAGKPWARVVFTLENHGRPKVLANNDGVLISANDLEFRSLSMVLKANLPEARASFEGIEGRPVASAPARLFQGHTRESANDESRNFAWEATAGAETLAKGGRALGFGDVTGNSGGLAAAVEYFWQNYPMGITAAADRLSVDLWPEKTKPDAWGRTTHIFMAPWHKTHAIHLNFHSADAKADEVRTRARASLDAPAVTFDPRWFADSGAWGLVAPAGLKVQDASLQEALDRYERFMRVPVDAEASEDKLDLTYAREHRILADGYPTDYYGWMFFGDFQGHTRGLVSALHYDWPYIMWLHFLRTGDRKFLDEAAVMTRHSEDLDQFHVDGDPWRDGMWTWEKTGGESPKGCPVHWNFRDMGPAFCYTHTWSGGYALAYLLTGEAQHLEALARTLNGSRDFWWERMKLKLGKPVPYDQTRSQGWCILHHLHMYRITGERKWIEDAYKLFSMSLLQSEHAKSGAWPTTTDPKSDFANGLSKGIVQTFHVYPIEPCVELHYWASKAGIDVTELTEFLKRWCDYTSTRFYVPPQTMADGKYLPWRNQYMVAPDGKVDPAKATCTIFNVMACSPFAYLGRVLAATEPERAARYAKIGREMFRDFYVYGGCGNKKGQPEPFDPKTKRNSIRIGDWPPQMDKTSGWLGRGSQGLLWALYQETKGRGGK